MVNSYEASITKNVTITTKTPKTRRPKNNDFKVQFAYLDGLAYIFMKETENQLKDVHIHIEPGNVVISEDGKTYHVINTMKMPFAKKQMLLIAIPDDGQELKTEDSPAYRNLNLTSSTTAKSKPREWTLGGQIIMMNKTKYLLFNETERDFDRKRMPVETIVKAKDEDGNCYFCSGSTHTPTNAHHVLLKTNCWTLS